MQTQPNKYIHWAIWISIALCLSLGLSFWAISYISFEWVKAYLDALAVDGNADKFTFVVFAKTVERLKFVSMGFFAISALFLLFKKPMQQNLEHHLTEISFLNLYRDIKHHISTVWIQTPRQHQILILVLFTIGIVIRLSFIFQPMRHDEAFTFTNYASKPLLVALSNYSFPNNHLFHTFLVHISYLCFGNQEWAIRLPAFCAGILFLPVIYLTIRQFYNDQVALITLALVVTASPLVEYSTNARGYMLICLFFFILLSMANYLINQPNKTIWICFSVLGALGLYTIPIMLYPLAIVYVWFLASILKTPNFRLRFRQLFLSGIAISLLTGLFYTPIFLGSGPKALFGNRFVRSAPSWTSFIDGLLFSGTELWQQWTCDYPLLLTLTLMVCLIIGCLRYSQTNTISLLMALPICLFIITMQRVIPPERTWLFLLPLFFAWAANGLIFIINTIQPQKIKNILLPITTLALLALSFPSAIQNLSHDYQYGPGTLHDAQQITQMLAPNLTATDRVLTIATAAPLEYYFNRQNVSIQHLRKPITDTERIILIVMESKYTLEEVLKISLIPSEQFSAPKLWHRYDSAAIYTLIRHPLPSPKSNI
ncbi:MAG: 4-amino-4-deoxy-L-arabinose transferase-like glycosyltransferase [Candidatus Latescibacterota bacterium]|jgi:4-amino-4-deoxy-L-arabinose transferase-like glycosyltransferase